MIRSFFSILAWSMHVLRISRTSAVDFPVLNPKLCPLRMLWSSIILVSLLVSIVVNIFLSTSSRVIGLVESRLP